MTHFLALEPLINVVMEKMRSTSIQDMVRARRMAVALEDGRVVPALEDGRDPIFLRYSICTLLNPAVWNFSLDCSNHVNIPLYMP